MLTASFWLVVLAVQAPTLDLILTVCISQRSPDGLTCPPASGAAIVTIGGVSGVMSMLALRRPLFLEDTVALPLVVAGLLLLGGSFSRPTRASARVPQGLR